MKYAAPRGTHDIFGKNAECLSELENSSRELFGRYNYSEIRTPTFEDAALFTRSIGEMTDIVEKEMYIFEDRKGRKIALRPEGTASVVRSYLENNLSQNGAQAKFFYMGSMFRYERPQAGRYREFLQIGAECFENPHPSADAEIILLASGILRAAGINDTEVHLNSLGCNTCRPKFKEALKEHFNSLNRDMCPDCQRRISTNPLRVLDCKIDGQKFSGFPKMESFLCVECKMHFEEVKGYLDSCSCSYVLNHNLVRGLDYYTRTIFEVQSGSLGAQNALAAGGRYDNLVEELGGKSTPAVGFALGSERVMLAAGNADKNKLKNKYIIYIAVAAPNLRKEAFMLAQNLRRQGSSNLNNLGLLPHDTGWCTVDGPHADKSLKSQLRYADKIGAAKVIIFGEDEFRRGAVSVRDMASQAQQEVSIKQFQ